MAATRRQQSLIKVSDLFLPKQGRILSFGTRSHSWNSICGRATRRMRTCSFYFSIEHTTFHMKTGTMVALLKHVGTADWYRERLNMSINTPASRSADALRTQLRMPSELAVLRGLTCLNILPTSATENESPQSLGVGHIGGTVLSSKQAKKVFSLSGSKTSVSTTWLVFPL